MHPSRKAVLGAVGVCLPAILGPAPAARAPSVAVEVLDQQGISGAATLEAAGASSCAIRFTGSGKALDACLLAIPASATELRLSGEVTWRDGDGRTRTAKGTQRWKLLDVSPMAGPLRDASRPLGEGMKALLAARPAFERGSGGLVEEIERTRGTEKATPQAVAAAEKRLGYRLPDGYASLVTTLGDVGLGDMSFTRPESIADAYTQMTTLWGSPREVLEEELTPKARAYYGSGTILFTEVGDGYGGLLYRPGPVAACGGGPAFSWFHQDEILAPRLLRRADGSCMDFAAAALRIVGTQLFQQYDDSGGAFIVVDRSASTPFRLKLQHAGEGPGPGFRLDPDWDRYE